MIVAEIKEKRIKMKNVGRNNTKHQKAEGVDILIVTKKETWPHHIKRTEDGIPFGGSKNDQGELKSIGNHVTEPKKSNQNHGEAKPKNYYRGRRLGSLLRRLDSRQYIRKEPCAQ